MDPILSGKVVSICLNLPEVAETMRSLSSCSDPCTLDREELKGIDERINKTEMVAIRRFSWLMHKAENSRLSDRLSPKLRSWKIVRPRRN